MSFFPVSCLWMADMYIVYMSVQYVAGASNSIIRPDFGLSKHNKIQRPSPLKIPVNKQDITCQLGSFTESRANCFLMPAIFMQS